MRSKRRLISYCLGLCGSFVLAASFAVEPERNPVIEAINLVATTHQAEIESADKGDWSLDTLRREWIVQRPFAPGVIDSTQLFDVTYKIDGKQVMSWEVDLRNKKVKKRE